MVTLSFHVLKLDQDDHTKDDSRKVLREKESDLVKVQSQNETSPALYLESHIVGVRKQSADDKKHRLVVLLD